MEFQYFKIQAWKSWKINSGHGKSWKIESLTLAKYFTYFQFTSHNNLKKLTYCISARVISELVKV